MEEFKDFELFVKRARAAYSHYGLVKVIPPREWQARKSASYADVPSMMIPLPIKQVLQGTRGAYQQYNIEQKPIQVSAFEEMAAKVKESSKIEKLSPNERDRAYWRTVAFNPVLYGADMPGSLFDEDLEVWNLAKLPSLLQLLPTKLAGINDPYIYFGMWKAAFAWHVEDMELYSINYLHYGEPKAWYSVPQAEMAKFEQAASTIFPDEHRACKQFLRHKQSVISPSILTNTYGITISTAIQEAGEFVITWPGAYHAGFNHGYNCAEAVNFALEDWIPLGQVSKPCLCDAQRALINMDYFVYQFEVYKYGKPITNPDLDIERFNRLIPAPQAPEIKTPRSTQNGSSSHSKAKKPSFNHSKASSTITSPRSSSSNASPRSNAKKSKPKSPRKTQVPAPSAPSMPRQTAPPQPTNMPSPTSDPRYHMGPPFGAHNGLVGFSTHPTPQAPQAITSPKKKPTVQLVTRYELAPRPQLIRPPAPGARVSARFQNKLNNMAHRGVENQESAYVTQYPNAMSLVAAATSSHSSHSSISTSVGFHPLAMPLHHIPIPAFAQTSAFQPIPRVNYIESDSNSTTSSQEDPSDFSQEGSGGKKRSHPESIEELLAVHGQHKMAKLGERIIHTTNPLQPEAYAM
jgi:hypothetical protein